MNRLSTWGGWSALALILVLPAGTYALKVGGTLSSDPKDWELAGTALSGIYGIILAGLTFTVLVRQLALQKRTTELQERTTQLQSETTAHMLAQTFVQDARADIQFFLNELEKLLDQDVVIRESPISTITPRNFLSKYFERASAVQLAGTEPIPDTDVNLKDLAMWLNLKCPRLQATWSGIYTLYYGLENNAIRPFDMLLVTSKQRTIAKIEMPMCIALDHYLYSFTRDGGSYPYQYSSVIPQP